MDIYERLKDSLTGEINRNGLSGIDVNIRCRALSAREAIGTPEHDDYPLIRGRETMVEAFFEGARGHAFADDFESADYSVEDLLDIEMNTNRKRASFIAGFNAVYRFLGLCEKTVHCRDSEPCSCARNLNSVIPPGCRVLLAGYQPRFLEALTSENHVRAIDLDRDNIGSEQCGIRIEPPENTNDAMNWSNIVLATGSSIVNGSINRFLDCEVPVVFYGVTISASAAVLGLKTFCYHGH